MDVQEVKDRIKEMGTTQKKVAIAIGMDPTAFNKWLKGARRLSAEEAVKLSAHLGIDIGFRTVRQLPVIGRVAAGNWQEAIQEPLGMIPCPDDSIPLDAFVVVVDGDSMDLVVSDGGRIVVDPTDLDLVSKKYYVIRNGDGETTFKQFLADPARLAPCSTNDNHRTIYPGRDEFTIVGRVTWRFDRM